MSSYTPNVNLALTPETTNETFKEWRTKMNGETNSNMTKIDAKFGEVKVELAALKSTAFLSAAHPLMVRDWKMRLD